MSSATRPPLVVKRATLASSTEGARLVAIVVAVAGLLLLGLRIELGTVYVPIAILFAIVVLPVSLVVFGASRVARLVTTASLLAAAGGLLLVALNPYHHRFSPANAVEQTSLLIGIPAVVLFVLWTRRFMPTGAIIATVGVGMLMSVDPTSALFSSNPWKFGYSLPTALLVLGIAEWSRSLALQLTALVVLIGITVTADARSGLAVFAMTLVLVVLQARRASTRPARTAVLLVAGVAVIAGATYIVGQQLILDGALGAATQARSAAQVAAGGSLLLGGRPELGATGALLLDMPLGFGAGAIPTSSDVHTAQAGMEAIGYNPYNGYVYRYMFGSGVQLHSIGADFWAIAGIPGLLLAAVVLIVLVAGTAYGTAKHSIGAGTVYVAVWSLWGLGFSPFGSSFVLLVLGLALVVPPPTGSKDGLPSTRQPSRISRRTPVTAHP